MPERPPIDRDRLLRLWPDFRGRQFLQALAEYRRRERRFERLSASVDGERLRAAR